MYFFIFLLIISCTGDKDVLLDEVLTENIDNENPGSHVISDHFTTTSDSSVVLNVLFNDNFPVSEEVRIVKTSSPKYGVVIINEGNLTVTYTPTIKNATAETIDTFTYTTEVVMEDQTISNEVGTVEVVILMHVEGAINTANYMTLAALSSPKKGDTTYVTDQRISGLFIYDSAQSSVNNGGTIIAGWVRQYEGALNVKWFGAAGNGTTDDTKAIQAALDLGGTITGVKDETYIISRVDSNVPNTIIDFTGSYIKSKDDYVGFMVRLKADNILAKGGTYMGNSANKLGEKYDHAVIAIENADYCTIEGITATDLYGLGIKLYDTNYSKIINNTIIQPGIAGIFAEPEDGTIMVGTIISGNYIEADNDDFANGISISSTPATNTWCENFLIDNNYIVGSLTAHKESNALLILVRCRKTTVSNNTTIGGRMGISNDNNEDGINLKNTISDFTQYGIELYGSEVGPIKNFLISENNIKTENSTEVYGIISSGISLDDIDIEKNTIEGGENNIFVVNKEGGICEGLNITENTLKNAHINVYITNAEDFKILNNHIENDISSSFGLFFDFSQRGIIDNNVFSGNFEGIAAFYNNRSLEVNDVTISNNAITNSPITTLLGDARFGVNINILNNN
ncbi:right-handed parallel beta-helix repeat-containing protein [Arenibacter algicola]|nr:right-handed parallel beta-helix repeat-containing protein [Arenibacter algicola]